MATIKKPWNNNDEDMEKLKSLCNENGSATTENCGGSSEI